MTDLPASRIPDPYEAPPLRWGILAPGGIAGRMAEALHRTRQRIVAVGSRSRERAETYASRYEVERTYDSYDALVADPDIDIVYVASPHSAHHAHALLAIAAGKHLLVEKSFTRNASEAAEVAAAARAAKVVCVEAMWPRFGPRFDIVRQVLAEGLLGEIVTVHADHNQPIAHVPRMQDPGLAGGALLDLGIYPVSFLSFVLGTPSRVAALGTLTDRGVDETISAVASGYASAQGALASMTTSMGTRSAATATICGTEARLELVGQMPFYRPGPVRVVRWDGTVAESPETGLCGTDALAYEAAHVAQLVADGAGQSPLMPLDETISIMGTMDEIRRQVGVILPGE